MMNCHGDDRKQEAGRLKQNASYSKEEEAEQTNNLIHTTQPALSTKFTTAMFQISFHQMWRRVAAAKVLSEGGASRSKQCLTMTAQWPCSRN